MVTFPGNGAASVARARHLAHGRGQRRAGRARSPRSASALEIGWRVIDTAEMYGEGGAEEVVGAALSRARCEAASLTRDEVFVVSKVYPQTRRRAAPSPPASAASPASASTTSTLYLLHWRGSVPLQETIDAFETLRSRGRIRHWGVSNFDVDDMVELVKVPGGERCATNQVYYSLSRARPGLRARALAAAARHGDDGLFADRPGHAGAQCRAARRSRASAARRRRSSPSPGSSPSPA